MSNFMTDEERYSVFDRPALNMDCGIRDGHPYTEKDTELLSDLPTDEQEQLLHWIRTRLEPSTSKADLVNPYNSYGLKHIYQHESSDNYVTNNQFKDAMLICGYEPIEVHQRNWEYALKKDCSALVEYKTRLKNNTWI